MATTITAVARELIDRALQLPPDEREAIAIRLLDSIDPPPNRFESKEAFRAELQRRIESIQNGTMRTYSIEETMAYLRQESSERRSQ